MSIRDNEKLRQCLFNQELNVFEIYTPLARPYEKFKVSVYKDEYYSKQEGISIMYSGRINLTPYRDGEFEGLSGLGTNPQEALQNAVKAIMEVISSKEHITNGVTRWKDGIV